jgi:hypothetical protein
MVKIRKSLCTYEGDETAFYALGLAYSFNNVFISGIA